jgi:hypothetical protein
MHRRLPIRLVANDRRVIRDMIGVHRDALVAIDFCCDRGVWITVSMHPNTARLQPAHNWNMFSLKLERSI